MSSPEPMIVGKVVEVLSRNVGFVKKDLLSSAYGLLDFDSSGETGELYMEMKLQGGGRYLVKGGGDSTLQRYLEFRKLQGHYFVVQSVKVDKPESTANYALVSIQSKLAVLFKLNVTEALKDPVAAILLGVTKIGDEIKDADISKAKSIESLDQLDTFYAYLAENAEAPYLKPIEFVVYNLSSDSEAQSFRDRTREIDSMRAKCEKFLEEAELEGEVTKELSQCMSPELLESIREIAKE